MHYPRMDHAKAVHPRRPFDIEETMLVAALKHSQGSPTMSDEDVKIGLLSLLSTCKFQQELIDELVQCVNELRTPKKKFWHRWM
jgi:hypothetical protein